MLYSVDAWFVPLDMTIRWKDFTELSGLPLFVIGFFPLAAIILAVWERLRRAPAGKAAATGAIVRTSLLVCVAAAAAVWLCREPVNRDTRTIARTLHHVMNGQWEAVLNEKTAALFADFPQRAVRSRNSWCMPWTTRSAAPAGSAIGCLPSRRHFFSDDPLLMLDSTHINGYVNWVMVLDLAMDLGMVNTAEKIAGEIMENMGPYPDITLSPVAHTNSQRQQGGGRRVPEQALMYAVLPRRGEAASGHARQ